MSLSYKDYVYNEDFPSRLDRWLKRQYSGCTQGAIEKSIRARFIRVNGIRTSAGAALSAGDTVSVEIHLHQKWEDLAPVSSEKVVSYSFNDIVLDETPEFMIMNKPSGLDVQGGMHVSANIDDWLKSKSREYRLVHRIDRATSGLLIVAKTLSVAVFLTRMFREHKIKKCYRAIVYGKLVPDVGQITLPISPHGSSPSLMAVDRNSGKPSITNYKVLHYNAEGNWSDVELMPMTGRKHQLRVHMSAIGHPIAGDDKYDVSKKALYLIDGIPRNALLLHAWRISFAQPIGNKVQARSWVAPLPGYWPSKQA
ncbi:MAG: RluA family pseudouridine synthase [Holosporales bacterium]|jgi:23S rRNA pseudouridine955/2504/2580 synthase|nr:RluA family pseudouridine synthase [Holosporales bacterium]